MVTIFQSLLDHKRNALEQARRRYDEAKQDVAALERAATMDLPDALLQPVPELVQETVRARRIQQIIDLFHRSGGTLHLREVMAELRLSKTSARRFMNGVVERLRADSPWDRYNGSQSRFVLRDGYTFYDPAPPAQTRVTSTWPLIPPAVPDAAERLPGDDPGRKPFQVS